MKRCRLWWLACAIALGLSIAACGYADDLSDGVGSVVFASEASSGSETVTDTTAPARVHYKATKIGSFKGDANGLREVDGMPMRVKDNKRYAVGLDGSTILSEPLDGAEYLGGDVFAVRTEQTGPNCIKIVSLSKGLLARKEFACTALALSYNYERRFAVVYVAAEETKDESKALVFEHEYGNGFLYDRYSYNAKKMYRGKMKVFDIQAGAFVDGVETTNPDSSFWDLGDSIIVIEDGVSTLYDPSGKKLWHGAGYADPGARSFCAQTNRTYSIRDSSGKVRFSSEDGISSIRGVNNVYIKYENNANEVIDMDGQTVLPLGDSLCTVEAEGLFSLMASHDTQGTSCRTVDSSGKTIAQGEIEALSIPGYVMIRDTKKDSSTLYSGGEALVSGLDDYNSKDLVLTDKDGNYYVFNDRKYSLWLGDAHVLDVALVSGRHNAQTMYGVYDLFTGEAITPTTYDKILDAGDQVLAHSADDGAWDVYSVERVPVKTKK